MCTGCNTSSVCSAWYEFCLENAAQARITCQLQIWDHAEWARCEAPARTKRRPSDWGKKAGCSFNMYRLQQVIVLFCLVWLCFRIWLHRRMTKCNIHFWNRARCVLFTHRRMHFKRQTRFETQARNNQRYSPWTNMQSQFLIHRLQRIISLFCLVWFCFFDCCTGTLKKYT